MKASSKSPISKPTRKRQRQGNFPDPTPILLASALDPKQVAHLLQSYGIQDWKRADQNLQAMAREPETRKILAKLLPSLLATVAKTAEPDQALNEWERYVDSGIHRLQLFQYLAALPHLVEVLGIVFGNSPAMSQTLIRDPLLVYWIEDNRILLRRQTRKALVEQLSRSLDGVKSFDAKCEALRRLKRREMLRIGIRDLLSLATPIETYTMLSDLAGVVIQAAYDLVNQDLQRRHGSWEISLQTTRKRSAGFSVLAMGKLGGWELNYSSDIDLIYVYQEFSGLTNAGKGQHALSASDYFQTLAQELTKVLSTATAEGALFRVDLRLRPEGQVGPLASPVQDASHYYQTRGRTWERLTFLKAKPIAGNLQTGRAFLQKLQTFVYGNKETANQVFPAIHNLRTQMVTKLARRKELDRNVKLGTGGIREIEFIVQGLQLRWGYQYPAVKNCQTLKSLMHLFKVGKLKLEVIQELKQAYIFLRNLETKIQMVHELQTHLLPKKIDEIAKCAIRMGYPKEETVKKTAEHLLVDYRRHTQTVHEWYLQIVKV